MPTTGSSGRFVFRSLVPYVARQAGIAAIRIGGGLKVDGTKEEWIQQMEQRASLAETRTPGKHVIASLTKQEAAILGHDGLKALMHAITEELQLLDNQRVGAIHVDATHLHMHEVFSIVNPDLSLAICHNEQRVLRKLAQKWEALIGVPNTADYSRISSGSKESESWSRLPSFAAYVQIAGKLLHIETSTGPQDYLERWARLGIWYSPTTQGGVLATIDDNHKVIRAKASLAGLTPPPEWDLADNRNILLHPSGYQRAIIAAKNRLFMTEPTYRQFLKERAEWDETGVARGRATRDALRAERVAFDLDGRVPRPDWEELEAAIIARIFAPVRVAMLARHAAAKKDIADHRPDASYGRWLRNLARSGDVAAGLVLARGRVLNAATPSTEFSVAASASHASAATEKPSTREANVPSTQIAQATPLEEIVRSQTLAGARLTPTIINLQRAQYLVQLSLYLKPKDDPRRNAAIAVIEAPGFDHIVIMAQDDAEDEKHATALFDALHEQQARRTAKYATISPTLDDPLDQEFSPEISAARAEQILSASGKDPVFAIFEPKLFSASKGTLQSGLPANMSAHIPKLPNDVPISSWSIALDAIDAEEQRKLTQLKQSATSGSFAQFQSIIALNTLTKRAQVNIVEHQHFALAGDLQIAPEKLYRSDGSRFEYDRIQRTIASIEIVQTTDPARGAMVFAGTSRLPSFFAAPESYEFTPLTGVHGDSMKIAILAAERRWGKVNLHGNGTFMRSAIQAAAELGVPVSNPELQEKWRAARDAFERQQNAQAKEFQLFQKAALDPNQQAVISVFGREVQLLIESDLADTSTRTTAHVLLRGVVTRDDTTFVVFEAESGRLQMLQMTDEIRANQSLQLALKAPVFGTGFAITTGGYTPLDIARSMEIQTQIDILSMDRKIHARVLLNTQVKFDQQEQTQALPIDVSLDSEVEDISLLAEVEALRKKKAQAALAAMQLAATNALEAATREDARELDQSRQHGRGLSRDIERDEMTH